MIDRFHDWLSAHEGAEWHWYVKRLSANDTLATASHQAGPYVSNEHAFLLFPSLTQSGDSNPKALLLGAVESHDVPGREVTITWYRAAKNECRITRWGGRSSPVLDPESTGSVAVFAFHKQERADADHVSVWVCNSEEEEVLVERIGPVEPGRSLLLSGLARTQIAKRQEGACILTAQTVPSGWLTRFPSGDEIIKKCMEVRPSRSGTPDQRLISRRDCEFSMFRSIESMHVLPRIQQGFESVDLFIEYSNSVNNRRKSRSGRSLELHVRGILAEEDVSFSHGEVSEGNKKPDFLFPSVEAYRLRSNPLWMLAAKTTCKDRWRQILNEADLIKEKHLLTLQEGVSITQFAEMEQANVKLVVPGPLHGSYPKQIRPKLMSLGSFISMVKAQ